MPNRMCRSSPRELYPPALARRLRLTPRRRAGSYCESTSPSPLSVSAAAHTQAHSVKSSCPRLSDALGGISTYVFRPSKLPWSAPWPCTRPWLPWPDRSRASPRKGQCPTRPPVRALSSGSDCPVAHGRAAKQVIRTVASASTGLVSHASLVFTVIASLRRRRSPSPICGGIVVPSECRDWPACPQLRPV